MRLCMFHPNDNPMERGWVGRVDGDRVVQLAAQTLQAFFLGGGGAREHAEYPLADVTLLTPVLQPPTVRLFDGPGSFVFANATAIRGTGAAITARDGALSVLPRSAAVIGAEQQIGGYALLAEWRAPGLAPPKDRDFALVLGPVVVTPDELAGGALEIVVRADGSEELRAPVASFDWEAARACAAAGTTLRPGDVLAGPAVAQVDSLHGAVAIEAAGIGALLQSVT